MDKNELIGKYWHELTKEQKKFLRKSKVQIGWLVKSIRQPDWCAYPKALSGQMGCWSLMDDDIVIDKEFCKACDRFIGEDK